MSGDWWPCFNPDWWPCFGPDVDDDTALLIAAEKLRIQPDDVELRRDDAGVYTRRRHDEVGGPATDGEQAIRDGDCGRDASGASVAD